MNEILKRSITGLFFIISILSAIYLSIGYTIGIFLLFLIMSLVEYAHFFTLEEEISFSKFYLYILSTHSYVVLALFFSGFIRVEIVFLLIPVYFITFIIELWRTNEKPLYSICYYLFPSFYIVLPFSLLIYLSTETSLNNHLLTGMFFMIWANDTFAYLGGLLFGKHKLFEKISPKKTWEGAISGFIFTIIFAWIWSSFLDKENGLLFWLISGLIVSPIAIIGDLFESKLKRAFHLKDSGNILPGHGGILDRFDATLLVVPYFFTWYLIYISFQ